MSELTDNDRLLELAGGCVHEWSDWAVTRIAKCAQCGEQWYPDWRENEDWSDLPAVGDGHMMNLGEMVRLVCNLHGDDVSVEIAHLPIEEVDPAYGWVANIYGNGHNGKAVVDCYGRGTDTPESALRAAILAAVDGAR